MRDIVKSNRRLTLKRFPIAPPYPSIHLALIPQQLASIPEFSTDTSIDTMGTSIESLERDGVEGLIDEDDPERILLGKELLEAAVNHFGKSDLAVILGLKETRAEAKRLGIRYDTYRKRLQRKIDIYRPEKPLLGQIIFKKLKKLHFFRFS
ncbi:hypothetical protein [Desulfosarcina ovata]|nr:hypothetical protein [Desulfosarcina ovata]